MSLESKTVPLSLEEQMITLKRIDAFVLNLRRRFILSFLSSQLLNTTDEQGDEVLSPATNASVLTSQLFLHHLQLPTYHPQELPTWQTTLSITPSHPFFIEWMTHKINKAWRVNLPSDTDASIQAFLTCPSLWTHFWNHLYVCLCHLSEEEPPSTLPIFIEGAPEKRSPFQGVWEAYFKPDPQTRMIECYLGSTLHLATDRDRTQWLKQLRLYPFPESKRGHYCKKIQRYLYLLSGLHAHAIQWHTKSFQKWVNKCQPDDARVYADFIRTVQTTLGQLQDLNTTLYKAKLLNCMPGMVFANPEQCITTFLYAYTLEFWVTLHDTFYEAIDSQGLSEDAKPAWFQTLWLDRFKKIYHYACLSLLLDNQAPTDKFVHPLHFPPYMPREARPSHVLAWWVVETTNTESHAVKRSTSTTSLEDSKRTKSSVE